MAGAVVTVDEWVRQPTHLRGVNWSNPDAHGLVVLLSGQSLWPINLVTMRPVVESANFQLVKFLTPFEGQTALCASPSLQATVSLTLPTNGLSTRSFTVGGRLRSRVTSGAGVGARAGTGNIVLWRNTGWDCRIGGTDYTAAGTYNLGQTYDYLLSSSEAAVRLFVDGQRLINGGVAAAGTLSDCAMYLDASGGGSHDLDLFWWGVWSRPLDEEAAQRVKANPWALFAP